VVVERGDPVPDALTAGSDRVGVRVPDHPIARDLLLRETGPLTATSANVSGRGSVTHPTTSTTGSAKASRSSSTTARDAPAPSTVVDPDARTIHRRGAMAGAIEAWLDDPPV